MGNIIGLGKESKKTLSSVIDLRNKLMAKHFIKPKKIIFLRGAQEEMFLKLLQLQTAPNPKDIIKWMFEHGVDKTIESYGFGKEEIININRIAKTTVYFREYLIDFLRSWIRSASIICIAPQPLI